MENKLENYLNTVFAVLLIIYPFISLWATIRYKIQMQESINEFRFDSVKQLELEKHYYLNKELKRKVDSLEIVVKTLTLK